ncbi:MAG: hypothetical protein L0332_08735 [Chloroflexi bacterium]|nr:hypothetical protein [Chloroflexota bacterium]MCI0575039.1 hypothetical protein [Chloroflexota bacterium]MCI0645126.1 hypothetical protein [Chloroflexota bacterium]MCI0726791.1 hypothetical protein [Chloroflexota bacterium]
MSIWRKIRGYVAAVVAVVACPCHLPLTLPLLLGLSAGTALGGWLAGNLAVIYAASVTLFLGGLFLAGKWLAAGVSPACAAEIPSKPRRRNGKI